MASKATRSSASRRNLLVIALIILTVYVVLPQLGNFHTSWSLLRHPNASWVLIAIGLTVLTYMAAGGTYYFLAFKPLRYTQLVLIEVAAMFVNRLLPAGIGALGTNYSYLRQRGHSLAQSATMVAANNLIGIIGHVLVVAMALVIAHGQVNIHHFGNSWSAGRIGLVLAGVGLSLAIAYIKIGKKRVKRALLGFRKPLLSYSRHPLKLLSALSTSISLTLCNVLCLSASALALGIHLPFIAVLLIFSLGVGAGTVTPTPGGLGGFEAGLFAGFVAYGVTAPTALAAALLYRVVSYWLPMILGALAFATAQRRKLFSS